MAKEIERKFLVINDDWRSAVVRQRWFQQGYLAVTEDCSVRVRMAGDRSVLNIKNVTLDIERQEYEYPRGWCWRKSNSSTVTSAFPFHSGSAGKCRATNDISIRTWL